MHKQYSCNEENEQQRKDLHLILHKNIQECPILDKNIQYTLSKKMYKKKKKTVLPRKKFFFKGVNFFFKKTSR